MDLYIMQSKNMAGDFPNSSLGRLTAAVAVVDGGDMSTLSGIGLGFLSFEQALDSIGIATAWFKWCINIFTGV